MIKKVKIAVPWAYVTIDCNGEEIARTFYEKKWKKQIEKSLELKM